MSSFQPDVVVDNDVVVGVCCGGGDDDDIDDDEIVVVVAFDRSATNSVVTSSCLVRADRPADKKNPFQKTKRMRMQWLCFRYQCVNDSFVDVDKHIDFVILVVVVVNRCVVCGDVAVTQTNDGVLLSMIELSHHINLRANGFPTIRDIEK